MKIEQLPSGSYRVRKQFNGKRVTLTFAHKPTQADVVKELAKLSELYPTKGSFLSCANSYIDSKSNVISPSTIKGYNAILKSLPKDFKQTELARITQIDIQKLINDYAVKHKPKTVRNVHGFVSAVLRQFRPDMVISTTLPQKIENRAYIPSEEDIKRILEASKDNPIYHVAFQLEIGRAHV